MNLIARTPSFVSSSTSVSPGKKYYGNHDPWKSVAGEDRSGQLGKETDLFEASDHYYHEQFMESFSSTDYSKLDYDRAWSSQKWKAEATTHDRSGQPEKTSWRMERQVRPDHEEILLDGTAQSVRYGETLRDRSGQLGNIIFLRSGKFSKFHHGRDTTELELFVESRSFVIRVNDQVRKRHKKNFRCRTRRRTFYYLGNVYGCNDGISDIHGEEFPRESEFHCEYYRSHTEANVRHIFKISGRTR